MKKNVRNALAISGLAIAIGASGLTLNANADMQKNGRGPRFESQQNPSKIFRAKKNDPTEKTKWHRRTIPGIVTTISANSFTVTSGNKSFTVNIAPETKILNRTWNEIALSEIEEGHKIRIAGTISGSTISAKTIRDISLPIL
ncbi:MAG: hypothetical protein ACD_8C00006G0009 [uncultured bacterium]|nr:MAG: hypothetical protein ACD_8C00006G0009 [uncultured bacterium]